MLFLLCVWITLGVFVRRLVWSDFRKIMIDSLEFDLSLGDSFKLDSYEKARNGQFVSN